MSETLITVAAVLGGIIATSSLWFFVGWSQGYRSGLAAGRAEPRTPSWSDRLNGMNELRKLMSKPGAVGEFLAAGEEAEVVEIEPNGGWPSGKPVSWYRNNARCLGCRYAGRYVLKGNTEELRNHG